MEYVLKSGDVIELDEQDYYCVVARTNIDDVEYADIIKYPDNPQDLYNEEKLVRKVVKVTVKGEDVFVDAVEDKKIQDKVRRVGDSKIKPIKRVKKA